jgi:hypothetical protein
MRTNPRGYWASRNPSRRVAQVNTIATEGLRKASPNGCIGGLTERESSG